LFFRPLVRFVLVCDLGFLLLDRHHFDNPVYCYPGGSGGPGLGGIAGGGASIGIGASLNNTRIRNNLTSKNHLTNLERAKLGSTANLGGASGDDDGMEGTRNAYSINLYSEKNQI